MKKLLMYIAVQETDYEPRNLVNATLEGLRLDISLEYAPKSYKTAYKIQVDYQNLSDLFEQVSFAGRNPSCGYYKILERIEL